MTISRPVLRYHGGKFGNRGTVADKIIANFPPHRVYVEPFGGSASVLLRKPRAHGEVYNDKWGGVVALFRVLRDKEKSAELERLLRLTPFAREEFEQSREVVADEIEQARRLVFRSFAGFASASGSGGEEYSTGFRANSNRSGTVPARDWANYPNQIASFTERLRGVIIENRDALEVMTQHDSAETLHYVDPPYVHDARSKKARELREYRHEMNDDQHRVLATLLKGLTGMVVLSGYHSALYDDLYSSWQRVEFKALADGARDRTEVLWFNDAAWERRKLPLEG